MVLIMHFVTRLPLHVDKVQMYWPKKAICSLIMCVICTSREDQDNLPESSEADEIAGDSQEPTNIKANPAYLSASTTQQSTMSADVVYSTIDEDNHQIVLQYNPAYFSLKKSVASLDSVDISSCACLDDMVML